jgi:hypothetical protein
LPGPLSLLGDPRCAHSVVEPKSFRAFLRDPCEVTVATDGRTQVPVRGPVRSTARIRRKVATHGERRARFTRERSVVRSHVRPLINSLLKPLLVVVLADVSGRPTRALQSSCKGAPYTLPVSPWSVCGAGLEASMDRLGTAFPRCWRRTKGRRPARRAAAPLCGWCFRAS